MTKNKRVLITGCSSGFGRAMVTEFLAKDWTVIATMRNASSRSDIFATELMQYGPKLQILELDVTSASDRKALRSLEIDCLVNNAGYGLFGALEDLTEEQLRNQMEVNFFGTALLIQDLLPSLRKSRGKMINISSVFGFSGFPLTSAYCASKFALEGLSESLRVELAPYGVQVTLVQPGGHRTQFSNSVVWGEKSFKTESSYLIPTQGYLNFKNSLATRPNPATPETLAQKIVAVASQTILPARVLVGKDANQMAFMRRSRIFTAISDFLVNLIYTKRFMRGSR